MNNINDTEKRSCSVCWVIGAAEVLTMLEWRWSFESSRWTDNSQILITPRIVGFFSTLSIYLRSHSIEILNRGIIVSVLYPTYLNRALQRIKSWSMDTFDWKCSANRRKKNRMSSSITNGYLYDIPTKSMPQHSNGSSLFLFP